MKTLITTLFLIPFIVLSQMYTWGVGTNPAWTSSNFGNNTLSWQPSINTVSTSGFNNGTGNWYRYNNNQTTNYTSPTIDFTGCNTSNYISVTLSLEINLETNYDFLYFQYSTDNGVTWINLGAWTGGLGAISPNYIIPKTANRFRFVFTSDNSVNSYTIGFTTYIYYADILGFVVNCPAILPIELISFKGYKQPKNNKLVWNIESETDCDYYTLERSIDGKDWKTINYIQAINSNSYVVLDYDYEEAINYYRLSQTDLNGSKVVYENELVSIDNRTGRLKIISITNLLGQSINDSYKGVVIITYEDGSIIRTLRE